MQNQIVDVRDDKFDIYIGRANKYFNLPQSKWANPFIIGVDGTRDEVIAKYEEWIRTQPNLLKDLPELKGKVLSCWCKRKNERCHGEILLKLMDEKEQNAPKKKVRLAIIGSRTFNDKKRLFDILDTKLDEIEMIVSGGAIGADELGRVYSEERGLPCIIHYAKWRDKNGNFDKGAGFKRNHHIIRDCTHVLAFWDGVSRGTKNSIDIAERTGKPVKVILFTPTPPQPDNWTEEYNQAWEEYNLQNEGTGDSPSLDSLFRDGFYAGIKAANKRKKRKEG